MVRLKPEEDVLLFVDLIVHAGSEQPLTVLIRQVHAESIGARRVHAEYAIANAGLDTRQRAATHSLIAVLEKSIAVRNRNRMRAARSGIVQPECLLTERPLCG